MIAEISNFVQSKEDGIPQAWGDIVPLRGDVILTFLKIMSSLVHFTMD
jgi:hypothetical protein